MTPSEALIDGPRSVFSAATGWFSQPLAHAQLVLLVLATWIVWRPVETYPLTAVVIAAVILALSVWAWGRTSRTCNWWFQFAPIGAVLLITGLSGWDPASALT